MSTLRTTTAGGPDEVSPVVPGCAEVRELLLAYQGLLDGVTDMRRTGWRPRRLRAWMTERLVVERVRRALALLERRYRLNRALAGTPDPSADDCHQRVVDFAASLRPPPSRAQWIWLLALIFVVGRIFLALAQTALPPPPAPGTVRQLGSPTQAALPSIPSSASLAPLSAEVERLSSTSPTNIHDLADVVLGTNLLVTCIVLTILGMAAWVVLRLPARGAIAARIVCGGSADHKRASFSDEHRLAARLRVHEREEAVFAANGIEGPADSRLDVIARVCLSGSLLLLAFGLWHTFLSGTNLGSDDHYGSTAEIAFTRNARYPGYAWVAVSVALLAALRFGRLLNELQGRRAKRDSGGSVSVRRRPLRTMLAVVAVSAVFACVFAVDAIPDHKSPSAWVTRPWHSDTYFAQGAIPLRYSCDEPCTVQAIRLLEREGDRGRPWAKKTDPPQLLEDERDPHPGAVRELVRAGVGDVYRLDSGATRKAVWRGPYGAANRRHWLRLWKQNGHLVAEVRVTDKAGNATTVPLDLPR